jgi:RimJ/RimL family protein N-acetyltransferase
MAVSSPTAVLHGAKVKLRPLRATDLETIRKWDDDADINGWAGKKFYNDDDSLHWWRETRLKRRRWALAVVAGGGQLIGQVELDHINWRNGSAELKMCIGDKSYWDRGYGTDALRTFLSYVFSRGFIEYVYLRVQPENARAIRCYEKCGFHKEGIFRAGKRKREGVSDLLLMGCRSWRYA